MATSSTQIANLALGRLAQTRITSLSEESAEARWANEFYAHARDYTTELYLWRHARKTATLVETTNTRSDDYDYAYTYPSDCLSFRYVLPEEGAFDPQNPIRFEAEQSLIFTDEASARCTYVAQITDVTKYPPSFTDAMAWYLAHLLVQPLRQENALLETTAKGFSGAVSHAIAVGAIEQESWVRTADESMPDWQRFR